VKKGLGEYLDKDAIALHIRRMYIHRTLERDFLKTSEHFKIILVTGMRQIGKTTFLKHVAEPGRKYVTLDNPKDLLLAREDPALFLQRYAPPVLIDEIQYAPELFPYLKMAVDGSEQRGQFWLTGSQSFLLMKGITESLAGRIAILEMGGFSLYELQGKAEHQMPFFPSEDRKSILQKMSVDALFKVIWGGSFPDIARHSAWLKFYNAYTQTYLERDVRQLEKIGNTLSFLKFLKAAAARTSQELNLAELARDADVAPNTAKVWLSILEASQVIFLLRPFYKNVSKRLIKAPKLYFTDTGLCSYLTEWTSPETLATGAFAGPIFETFVVNEIRKSFLHNGIEPQLYFYRDQSKQEIDLIISHNSKLYPVEIKKTANPLKDDVKSFATFRSLGLDVGYGNLICLTDAMRPLTSTAAALPLWEI